MMCHVKTRRDDDVAKFVIVTWTELDNKHDKKANGFGILSMAECWLVTYYMYLNKINHESGVIINILWVNQIW